MLVLRNSCTDMYLFFVFSVLAVNDYPTNLTYQTKPFHTEPNHTNHKKEHVKTSYGYSVDQSFKRAAQLLYGPEVALGTG